MPPPLRARPARTVTSPKETGWGEVSPDDFGEFCGLLETGDALPALCVNFEYHRLSKSCGFDFCLCAVLPGGVIGEFRTGTLYVRRYWIVSSCHTVHGMFARQSCKMGALTFGCLLGMPDRVKECMVRLSGAVVVKRSGVVSVLILLGPRLVLPLFDGGRGRPV